MKNLSDLRKKQKLSQEKVAEQLSCTKSYISQIEIGKKKPNLKKILKLAELYKVSIQEIVNSLGYCPRNACIAIYNKETKELIADINSDEIILHNDFEAEIYFP